MLVLDRVAKSYSKGARVIAALAPLSLTVGAGQLVAVQGRSGSGKTTALLIAGGLLRPDSGRVEFQGHDLHAMTPNRLAAYRAENIGFVFQQYHLIPYLSILENILAPEAALGRRNGQGRGRELARQFGLEHRLDHRPAELSSGEKQRTALARALLFRPKLLLADEITGTWIGENAHIVLDHLREYVRSGGAVLMVTHDGEIACQADRIEHLSDYRKLEAGQ